MCVVKTGNFTFQPKINKMGNLKTVQCRMIAVSFVFCALFVGSSVALKCYQCSGSDSDNPFQCNEWLTNDIDIQPEACDKVYDAKYCVKHVGRFEGGIGAKRFCSSLDLGNYCNYVQQPGDILSYRTCTYTCTGDGCNSAFFVKPNYILIVSLGLFLVKYVYQLMK